MRQPRSHLLSYLFRAPNVSRACIELTPMRSCHTSAIDRRLPPLLLVGLASSQLSPTLVQWLPSSLGTFQRTRLVQLFSLIHPRSSSMSSLSLFITLRLHISPAVSISSPVIIHPALHLGCSFSSPCWPLYPLSLIPSLHLRNQAVSRENKLLLCQLACR